MASDDYWPAVAMNLWKARNKWDWLTMILAWEGSNAWVSRKLFKLVVHTVLFFGLETWVITPDMGWDLGGLQYWVDRWITGQKTRWRLYGKWNYPPLGGGDEGSRIGGSQGISPEDA